MTVSEEKWMWMMDYCRKNNLPPAQQWAWSRAEKEYEKYLDQQHSEDLCFALHVVED